MPPPDSSEIDAALIELLQADSELHALMPDGVYYAEAKQGARQFVIVNLIEGVDVATFGQGRSIEDCLYLVKAVAMDTGSGSSIKAAAARIDVLLENSQLTVPGYTWMTVHRMQRIRATEVDDIDNSIRWQHRGGQYRVQMAVV